MTFTVTLVMKEKKCFLALQINKKLSATSAIRKWLKQFFLLALSLGVQGGLAKSNVRGV
jgi:hypothetical protein